MKAEERRRAIAKTLTAEHPVSATALAGQFSVSRQIIVGDIALLRAAGLDIVATPRGYKLGETTGLLRAVACVHSAQETETELLAMVDNGCTVLDVAVDHPLYGQIRADLIINNRLDVAEFVDRMNRYNAQPLKVLTGDYHYHTVTAESEKNLDFIEQELRKKGYLKEE